MLLELDRVTKSYQIQNNELSILKGVSLQIPEGEFCAFMGPSGSGKTTLLHIMGALDHPTTGRVLFQGADLAQMDQKELAHIRNQAIGFVFQNFYLLPYYTALENVCMPLFYAGTYAERKQEGEILLEKVGLKDRLHHRPNELSGGERQRVAIARSLINHPQILFADEPTGNLDSKNGVATMELLHEINASGCAVVLITHDPHVAGHARKQFHVQDGIVT